MQYIYGNNTLKTIGKVHTDFSGYLSTSCEYGGVTIIDRCKIVNHYRSEEDAEGNKYDWYTISDHYRYEDRQVEATENADALAELMDIVANQDDAIAEMMEMIGGK